MADKRKDILWEVGCEGHVDAWVIAPNWEQATVEAAKFWGVNWGTVVAKCEQKKKIVGAPRNICCKCDKAYFGSPPMCTLCKESAELEEKILQHRLVRAYRCGKVI